MTPPHAPPIRVAVIGAGITGLSAALRLQDLAPDAEVRVYESDTRVGGVLRTARADGWLVEHSADNFLTRLPHATRLCERLGIAGELLETDPARRRALVVHNGRVVPTPEGFLLMSARAATPILRTPLLSWPGRLRLLAEPLIPRRQDTTDESVAAFARRRVGRQAFERLVQPLLAGIYTADPERLSMQATMPQFVQQERQHGSLFLAARRRAAGASTDSGAAYSQFLGPREGMQSIADAAATRLAPGTLQTGAAVVAVRGEGAGWRVEFADAPPTTHDAVIVTAPSYAAADLLRGHDERLAAQLDEIEYASSSVVCLGVREDQLPGLPAGFGFVVPAVERRRVLAASFASLKFPGRAPAGRVLIRVFFGGALQPELADLPDTRLVAIAMEELGELVGLRGAPELTEIARWPRRMPQYHVGHVQRVDAIDERAARHPGLAMAGAAYRGVGVPQCIDSGEQAAERVLKAVARLGRP